MIPGPYWFWFGMAIAVYIYMRWSKRYDEDHKDDQ
jgi:hypothetical protein